MCAEPLRQVKLTEVTVCREKDLAEILEILEASPEAAAWSATGLAEALARDPSHFLVGWQREEITGFITGRRMGDEGEILNLAVRTQSRRQGVGRALAKELLEVFAREKVLQVFLEVRESNEAAAAFYKWLGFRQAGRRERYYREPEEAALVLALTMASRESRD
jgi:ribosomal-protein-alanine acetyltransferase